MSPASSSQEIFHPTDTARKKHDSGSFPCEARRPGLREPLRSKAGQAPALDDDGIIERIESLLDHEQAIDLPANVPLAVENALLSL